MFHSGHNENLALLALVAEIVDSITRDDDMQGCSEEYVVRESFGKVLKSCCVATTSTFPGSRPVAEGIIA